MKHRIKNLIILTIITSIANNLMSIPDNIFGTDGIRAQVGVYPLDDQSISKLGHAIGQWAIEKYGEKDPKLLIAQDTRISCQSIINLLTPGLIKNKVIMNNHGVLPTPVAFYLSSKYDFALIISASHNPCKDNGIKIIDRGNKLRESDEKRITQLFYDSQEIVVDSQEDYINFVLEKFKDLDLSKFKIILDTANGAQYKIAPTIFKKLGANIIVINNSPDGYNINENCGSTYPETLQELVITHKADIGFAFDGDGDRVIAVDSQGNIKDGDDILALLSNNPDYKDNKYVIGTILANYGLEKYLEHNNKQLLRTSVGDKYVAKELKSTRSYLGGEPSGHIILNNITNTGDGVIVALKILESLKYTNNSFVDYDKYFQINLNIPIKTKKDLSVSPIKEIIENAKNKISGRLVIRYSGTENVLRIMAESLDKSETELIVKDLAKNLQQHLA